MCLSIKSDFAMDESDFYVTLPSNGASLVYPRNRPTSYRTDLCVSRGLLTDWEVGLAQIQFTRDWYYETAEFVFLAWLGRNSDFAQTYPEGYVVSALERKLLDIGAAEVQVPSMDTRLVTVPAYKRWRHVDEFGHEVARLVEEAFKNSGRVCTVALERRNGITSFRGRDRLGALTVGMSSESDEMFQILGITARKESSKLSNTKLQVYMFLDEHPVPCRIRFADVGSIFVYTDVCEEQLVGSQVANLLKLVPVTAAQGERQSNDYDRPTYVRLKPMHLKNIEIKLCDLTGNELPIWNPNSLVTVVLHFRKRKPVGWY